GAEIVGVSPRGSLASGLLSWAPRRGGFTPKPRRARDPSSSSSPPRRGGTPSLRRGAALSAGLFRPLRGLAAVLRQSILDLARRDAEDLGGLAGAAADVLEGLEDHVALDLGQRCTRDVGQRVVTVLALHDLAGQVARLDLVALAHHHGALD